VVLSPADAAMDGILRELPHRPPFRFVDELVALEPGVAAQGLKTFPATEPFFAGHFPGDPIVPGVILTEALAQLSGLVAAAAEPGARFLLASIRQMKFLRAVRPDESIQLAARSAGALGPLLRFEVRAEVAGALAAEGELMLSRAPSAS
jgi:3-hydroxyacyl-[acyl-carrier-protein] dehydratase